MPTFWDALIQLLPPVVSDTVRKLKRSLAGELPQWEYRPDGWASGSKGWDGEGIAKLERVKWDAFVAAVESTGPFGVNHEDLHTTNENVSSHNTILSFAYVMARTAASGQRISILDWGSGLGHYYVIARNLFPDLDLDYHCLDLAPFCRYGREVLPHITFHESDTQCRDRTFDLVFSSSSLQYAQDWQAALNFMASVAEKYLYITRLPTAFRADSFVVLQRPYALGYPSEYLGWVLNRDKFLLEVAKHGLDLVREFIVQEQPVVAGAPENPRYRGFLFHR
jgi:putative methyltransferase (TIGR04325 family)